jgi:hypothetical protein
VERSKEMGRNLVWTRTKKWKRIGRWKGQKDGHGMKVVMEKPMKEDRVMEGPERRIGGCGGGQREGYSRRGR